MSQIIEIMRLDLQTTRTSDNRDNDYRNSNDGGEKSRREKYSRARAGFEIDQRLS